MITSEMSSIIRRKILWKFLEADFILSDIGSNRYHLNGELHVHSL